MNTFQDQTALSFFNAMGYNLNPQVVRVTESDFYTTGNLKNGAATVEIIEDSQTKVYGERNFSNAKFPQGENVACAGIAFEIASDSTATSAGLADYSFKTANVPAIILNAELIVEQNDKPIFPPLRIGKMLADSEPLAMNHEKFYAFKTYKLIEADNELQIKVRFPKDGSLGAAPYTDKNYYIRIHFVGAKTMRKVA